MKTLTAEELIVRNVPTRYGLHVLELGEDGGTLVVPGHHDDRRTLAALNHYARNAWGQPLDGLYGVPAPALNELQRIRAIVVHGCHRGWLAEDEDGERLPADRLQVVDPAVRCADCDQADSLWALLYAEDAQNHPAAFPITVWECDA